MHLLLGSHVAECAKESNSDNYDVEVVREGVRTGHGKEVGVEGVGKTSGDTHRSVTERIELSKVSHTEHFTILLRALESGKSNRETKQEASKLDKEEVLALVDDHEDHTDDAECRVDDGNLSNADLVVEKTTNSLPYSGRYHCDGGKGGSSYDVKTVLDTGVSPVLLVTGGKTITDTEEEAEPECRSLNCILEGNAGELLDNNGAAGTGSCCCLLHFRVILEAVREAADIRGLISREDDRVYGVSKSDASCGKVCLSPTAGSDDGSKSRVTNSTHDSGKGISYTGHEVSPLDEPSVDEKRYDVQTCECEHSAAESCTCVEVPKLSCTAVAEESYCYEETSDGAEPSCAELHHKLCAYPVEAGGGPSCDGHEQGYLSYRITKVSGDGREEEAVGVGYETDTAHGSEAADHKNMPTPSVLLNGLILCHL